MNKPLKTIYDFVDLVEGIDSRLVYEIVFNPNTLRFIISLSMAEKCIRDHSGAGECLRYHSGPGWAYEDAVWVLSTERLGKIILRAERDVPFDVCFVTLLDGGQFQVELADKDQLELWHNWSTTGVQIYFKVCPGGN